jgi:hypothetical protein
MLSEGIMPAWTSESTVVKSFWIVAIGSITGGSTAGWDIITVFFNGESQM